MRRDFPLVRATSCQRRTRRTVNFSILFGSGSWSRARWHRSALAVFTISLVLAFKHAEIEGFQPDAEFWLLDGHYHIPLQGLEA